MFHGMAILAAHALLYHDCAKAGLQKHFAYSLKKANVSARPAECAALEGGIVKHALNYPQIAISSQKRPIDYGARESGADTRLHTQWAG